MPPGTLLRRWSTGSAADVEPPPPQPLQLPTHSSQPTAPPALAHSYFLLVLRIYHVWCMFVGLLMVVAVSLQLFLGIYVDFFARAWVWTDSASALALFASATCSILVLNMATALCYAAVWLLKDAWRTDCFLVFRSLMLFRPLHLRRGVPMKVEDEAACGPRADFIAQLLICLPLDILPLVVVCITRRVEDWAICVAGMSCLHVLVFWSLEVVHDYVCKAKALKALLRGTGAPARQHPPLTLTTRGRDVSSSLATETAKLSSGRWVYEVLRDEILVRPWLLVFVVLFLWILCAWRASEVTEIFALAITCLAGIHAQKYRWCLRCQSIVKVTLRTEGDRSALCACIDDHFNMTASWVGDGWSIPADAQLVNDGFLTLGDVRRELGCYPMGAVLSFRLKSQGEWGTFLDTHCGAGPEQLVENSLVTAFLGFLVCSAMYAVDYHTMAFACAVSILAYTSPVFCAFFAPRVAQWLYVCVSFLFACVGLVAGMLATSPNSLCFWLMPGLCIATHFLLARRLQYMQLVKVAFMLLFTLVIALFLSLSFFATLKNPVMPSHEYSMSRNFSFPASGTRNPFHGGAVSPACALQYPTGNPSRPLRIQDFGFFNKIVYEPEGALERQLELWLGEFKLVKQQRRELGCLDAKVCNTQDWVSWFVFAGKVGTGLENTTVVTIRGTKTQLEMIFDLDLWNLWILGLHKFAANFPSVGPVFSAFWNSPAVGRWWFAKKKSRYGSVLRYLQDRLEQDPGHNFYLSGHSLGGGLAQLLAAELKRVPAVTLSAPGSYETIGLIGLDPQSVQGLVVNVVPEGDPIPLGAGRQAGVTLPIPCLAGLGAECHRVFNTACELLRECGDPQQRVLPCAFCPPQAARSSDTCAHTLAAYKVAASL